VDEALKAEFRAGFYPDKTAAWIERGNANQSGDVQADIAARLAELAAGRRDFAYPIHDASVYELLQKIVPGHNLRHGADIGCATGCFPAMQLAAGVERCTVFEVRNIDVNDDRVGVRIQDLTYAEGVEPEFDLITCLSTIEHVGLGRYGDPIDPWGDVKMAGNLRALLRPGGVMFISFPVGRGTVVYNAHRIYSEHRRSALFGDLRLIARAPGRSRLGQLRHRMEIALRKPGAFSQPVYVLQKPV
jgi:SAM-dependent methyltransferase